MCKSIVILPFLRSLEYYKYILIISKSEELQINTLLKSQKMQIVKLNIELRVNDSLMRVDVASHKPASKYPGIVFYSDIYQLGDTIIWLVNY
jgi:carboxymethylenebutenolidase